MTATAREKVEAFILDVYVKQGVDPRGRVEIVEWGATDCGVRVAEVSYWLPTWNDPAKGWGFSFMQSTLPDGLAVCAQVERVMVAIDSSAFDEEDVVAESELLKYLLLMPDVDQTKRAKA